MTFLVISLLGSKYAKKAFASAPDPTARSTPPDPLAGFGAASRRQGVERKNRAAQGGPLNRGAPCHGIIGILVNPALVITI